MGHARTVRNAFGFLHPGELDLLQHLARTLPPEPVMVNIGAGAGTSGLALVEARSDGFTYTVDIQDTSSPYGSLEGERNAFFDAGQSYLLGDCWFQIHGDSVAVGQRWQDESYPLADLVFIDGDHSYEGCAADIRTWLPNLLPGGILAVHDYGKAEYDPTEHGRANPYPGVDRAVDELLRQPGYPLVAQVETLIVFRKDRPF